MKIHLARLGDRMRDLPVESMAAMLVEQAEPRHVLSIDPDQADVIVFAQCHMLGSDWRLNAIKSHALAARFPGKIYVYDERDRPWARYPGMYVSMRSRHFRPAWQIAAPYPLLANAASANASADVAQDFLFSFMGSPSAQCRYEIYALGHTRSYVERTDGFVHYDPASVDFSSRSDRFVDVLARSKFVLCPRGQGVSSLRLYEVLAAGRVPVVIADEWVPPLGPDWGEFSIRWPEARIRELPAELERREGEYDRMAATARAAYLQWFARDQVLNHQFDQLELIAMRQRRGAHFPKAGYRDGAWRTAAVHEASTAIRGRLSPIKRTVTARLLLRR